MDDAFAAHYNLGVEEPRLMPEGAPNLEFVRTLELLKRFLPPPPASILDVGGGPGVYASLLARCGYRVHLVDIVELHVEQAEAAAAAQPEASFEGWWDEPRRREIALRAARLVEQDPALQAISGHLLAVGRKP